MRYNGCCIWSLLREFPFMPTPRVSAWRKSRSKLQQQRERADVIVTVAVNLEATVVCIYRSRTGFSCPSRRYGHCWGFFAWYPATLFRLARLYPEIFEHVTDTLLGINGQPSAAVRGDYIINNHSCHRLTSVDDGQGGIDRTSHH